MINLKKILIFTLLILSVGLVVSCGEVTTTNQTTSPSSSSSTSNESTTNISTTNSSSTADVVTTQPPITTNTTFLTTEATTSMVETTTNGYIGIEVTEINKIEYEYNSTFDEDSIVVVLKRASGQFIVLSKGMYTVTGFDSTVEGEIELTVTYTDFTDTFYVTILPYEGFIISMPYYQSAEGLTGNALFLELRDIVNTGFVGVSYGDARYILDESDADPNNPNNVILVYLGTSVSGTWDNGITWNREHVWPQSLLGVSVENSDINVGSDLQNLKPANPSENSSRGNKYFDNVTTSSSYEPRDEVKGDVARILFYMWTKWDFLSLVDSYPSTYQMAMLSVLLEWHELDPVDDFERNRNEVIYSYQNNRNPYIDYPEFVELIWG